MGYEIGHEQVLIPTAKAQRKATDKKILNFRQNENTFTVGNYKVDKHSGMITSICNRGKELLATPIAPYLWRAPTDNDRKIKVRWYELGFDRLQNKCLGCTLDEQTDERIVITTRFEIAADGSEPIATGNVSYIFTPDEEVTMSFDVNVNDMDYVTVPRLGVMFEMPCGIEKLKYFGRGPFESYEDKIHASTVGIYSSSVAEHFEHYIRPQENMAHAETRWAEIYSEAGHGLMITSTEDTETISFNCSHYTPIQLTETKHDYELVPKETTVVNIDYKQAGIGSGSCGTVLNKKYRLNAGNYKYSFRIMPVIIGDVDPFEKI